MATEDTESQRKGVSELRSNRDAQVTQDSQEFPPLAASVKTLPEAVELSLLPGNEEDLTFVFARALKAFELTNGTKLSAKDLKSAFAQWWNRAKPQLPADADFEEYQFVFQDAFEKVRTPLGANPLLEAIHRADTLPPPPDADRFQSAKLRRLIAVCYHLQVLSANQPFFLGIRDAGRITEAASLHRATSFLRGLVREGILREEVKGTPGGRRATRYRYLGQLPHLQSPAGGPAPQAALHVSPAPARRPACTPRTELDPPPRPFAPRAAHELPLARAQAPTPRALCP